MEPYYNVAHPITDTCLEQALMLHKTALLGVTILLLGGCASVPENLRTPENTAIPSVNDVRLTASAPMGQIARWGGEIVGVQTLEDKTRVEILAKPLNEQARPHNTDRNEGRFAAYFSGFLEPAVYANGREITVRGRIDKTEIGKVGDSDYRFPTLNAMAHKLWPKREPVVYQEPDIFFGYGFYPWYIGGHHHPHRRHYRR